MAFFRRQGRPAGGGKSVGGDQPKDRRIKRLREEGQRRRSRLVLIFGGLILLVIAGVTISLWYTQFYAPPRVKAAIINDTRFSQGDLVKRVRMIQAAQGYTGSTVGLTEILRVLYNPDIDITAGPFTMGMVQMELLKQGSAEYGIEITDDIIDATINRLFIPKIPEGQISTSDQIERETKERYETYLNVNRITEREFRRMTEERMYFSEMREALGTAIASERDHVEVSWLRTPLRPDASLGEPAKWQDLRTINERLKEEEFEMVAREYSAVFRFAAPNGYVGWIPKGAFPKFDGHLWGDDEIMPLNVGEISPPLESGGYVHFVRVDSETQVRELEDVWKERLKDMSLQAWLVDRFAKGTSEGWVEVKYDSKIYAWAADQLNQTARQKRGDVQPN